VANLPTTVASALGTLVIRLHPKTATASTLAEDITNLKPGDLLMLREENTTPLP